MQQSRGSARSDDGGLTPTSRTFARPRRQRVIAPELVWPGKIAAEVVPLRPPGPAVPVLPGAEQLIHVDSVGSDGENLLIMGDNADGLAALAGSVVPWDREAKVKLCYLDPPFNTGSRFTHYDDSVDDARWLGDLRTRLELIASLLAADGSIWLHLDDRRQHHGRCLLDDVFGPTAFVSTVVWQKRCSRDNRTAFSSAHDYIHVYAPAGPKRWKAVRNGLPDTGSFVNPDDDPRGPWRSVPLTVQAGHATAAQFYTVVSPTGEVFDPPPGRCWTYSAARFEELVRDGRVYWPRNGAGRPRLKRFAAEATDLAPTTLWLADDVGQNATAKKELLALFPDCDVFDTPKPERLLERVVHIATSENDIVLDPYLGSGTTAAVAHKTRRRWIGIEATPRTVRDVVVPRLRRVVDGDDRGGITPMSGWAGGGGFSLYATISDSGSADVLCQP